ncbi:CobW family GTP-binding protein [Achromobacter aloeverae]
MTPAGGAAPAAARPRIPLTVIGGFLGAGKTTLLNRLLSRWRDRRCAILVNDFGAINIDAELVDKRDETLISLANGCVCCQIGDDLGDALMRVLALDPAPGHIVIETSGVSDPWRVAQVGLADPALALDSVIVLVDARAAPDQDADPLLRDMLRRQLVGADLLVVNKCDGMSGAEMDALRDWLDHAAPGTPRFETVHAAVPDVLLSDPGLDDEGGQAGRQRRRSIDAGEAGKAGEAEGAEDVDEASEADGPAHGYVFEHWRFDTPHALDAERLRALLRDMPVGVLRLKGLVRTDRHPAAVIQFAGRHGSLRAAPAQIAAGARGAGGRAGRIVAIGLRGQLPREALARALQAATVVDLSGMFSPAAVN